MKLRDIGWAVPSSRYSSEEISAWSGLEKSFIENRIGVHSRAFLGADELPSQLAARACEALLSRHGAPARGDIGLLVVVTQTPDYKIPHSSALLQRDLGLESSTACFDINLGCSGFVYALSVVKAMMLAEDIGDAIIVTCDPYSRIMGRGDRDTVALFGDAATATWMSASAGADIGRADFGTDGHKSEHLIVRSGAGAEPFASLFSGPAAATDAADAGFRLHMNGRGIFNFVMERIPQSVARALEKNRLRMEQIDYFVFHQGSKFLLEQLTRHLELPERKVPSNVANYGNTVSSSVPLLLAELMEEGGRLAGKKVLVSGFGVGLSWATNILSF